MTHDDFKRRNAQCVCSQNVFLALELEHLSTNQTCDTAPAGQGQRQHHGADALGIGNNRNQDYDNQIWDTQQYLNDTHHNVVYNAAEVGSDTAVDTADDAGNDCTDNTDHNRNTSALPYASKQVTTQRVGTKPVLCTWFLVDGGSVHLLEVIAGDSRSDTNHYNQKQQNNQCYQCDFIFFQSSPCVCPVANLWTGNDVAGEIIGADDFKLFRRNVFPFRCRMDILFCSHGVPPYLMRIRGSKMV